MSNETPDPRLTPFTQALASAAPNPGHLNRDALLFAAGRAVQARHDRLWQYSTAALFLLSAGLGSGMMLRSPGVVDRVVYVQQRIAPPAPQPTYVPPLEPARPAVATTVLPEESEEMRLRERILREGVAGLPPESQVLYEAPLHLSSEGDLAELKALRRSPGSTITGGFFR